MGLQTFTRDNIGCLLGGALLVTLLLLPVVSLEPNRIMPGEPLLLWEATSLSTLGLLLALLLPTCGLLTVTHGLPLRLILLTATLLSLFYVIGASASELVAQASPLARVSLGSGFWGSTFCLALLLSDNVIKLALAPLARLAWILLLMASILALLASGHWDNLSLLKEYHSQSDFWAQGLRHLQLSLGSLVPALLVGIPLGIRCHRSPRLHALLLPLLNVLQTIPSLAMFGMLMVPLGLLAHHYPIVAKVGISGIGAAPAIIALFFYALLPIVSNTRLGFAQVDSQVREAARGMGMSAWQSLWQVEFPLAMPVILTGVRVILVMNIGLVAVAALVGGGGFGTYIFQGLGQAANELVMLGALPTVILAFLCATLIDTLIALQQRDKHD